jgi:phosphatidylglycerophosphate synthase
MNFNDNEPYVCKINEDGIRFVKHILSPLIPYLSKYTTSKQLTLCTLLWCLLVIVSGFLARHNKYWLSLSIFALLGHIVTDVLDGALSTYQNDGLEKWNFFMDHILDFIFTISVFVGLVMYFYKKQTIAILPLFIIFAMVVVNMAASFLLIVERGLDLGINVHECFAFNIFHLHLIMVIFYIYIMMCHKRINIVWIWVVAFILTLLTVYNIYKRQADLTKINNNK